MIIMEINKSKYFELLNLKDDTDLKKVNIENKKEIIKIPEIRDLAKISIKNSNKLISPSKLFNDLDYSNLQKITEGLYYDNSKRTRNGAIVRGLFIDTNKLNISAEFNNGKSVSKNSFIKNDKFLASINGQFFANGLLLGDIKAGNKIYLDNGNHDKVSDKRFFISINNKGNILTGKAGLEENLKENTSFFLGGLLRLYDNNKIYKDTYSGDSQNSSIARTFIGIDNNNNLSLVTIGDGANRNKGASFDESIKILKSMNIKTAFILDGGGSTNIIIKNNDNTKTDGRSVNSYISVYKK